MKTVSKILILAVALSLLSGCIVVKQATVSDTTVNAAGWKSQAGGRQNAIEATTDATAEIPLTESNEN